VDRHVLDLIGGEGVLKFFFLTRSFSSGVVKEVGSGGREWYIFRYLFRDGRPLNSDRARRRLGWLWRQLIGREDDIIMRINFVREDNAEVQKSSTCDGILRG